MTSVNRTHFSLGPIVLRYRSCFSVVIYNRSSQILQKDFAARLVKLTLLYLISKVEVIYRAQGLFFYVQSVIYQR